MTREEAIECWEGLRKTFSNQLEQEENHFGRMHLQTTIDAIDMAISALRKETVTNRNGLNEPTNADRIAGQGRAGCGIPTVGRRTAENLQDMRTLGKERMGAISGWLL